MYKLEREEQEDKKKLVFSLMLGPQHDNTLLSDENGILCSATPLIRTSEKKVANVIHKEILDLRCSHHQQHFFQYWSDENIAETKLIATPRETPRMGLADELKRLSRVLAYSIQSGGIHELVMELEKKVDSDFLSFKEDLKQHAMDETQFCIAKSLNAIEERAKQFPLLSPKQAAILLGDIANKNPSRTINKAKEDGELFVFYFGNAKTAQIPSFQFNTNTLGVWEVIPKLVKTLGGLNDWGVYSWFTTESDDLGCTPAEAVSKPETYNDLRYLAGLFKSESTLRDLDFIAANNEVD